MDCRFVGRSRGFTITAVLALLVGDGRQHRKIQHRRAALWRATRRARASPEACATTCFRTFGESSGIILRLVQARSEARSRVFDLSNGPKDSQNHAVVMRRSAA